MNFKTPINWKNLIFLVFFHLVSLYACKDVYYLGKWVALELFLWWQITGFGITAGAHRLWSHKR